MLDKPGLKQDLKTLYKALKEMTDEDAAMDKLAGDTADAIEKFVKSASVIANPAAVTAAAMSNTGGPVAASNNLESAIS